MGKGPVVTQQAAEGGLGLKAYYTGKIEELELLIKDKSHNLRRLEAQRNEINTSGAAAHACCGWLMRCREGWCKGWQACTFLLWGAAHSHAATAWRGGAFLNVGNLGA
jgi:hypothetical protein